MKEIFFLLSLLVIPQKFFATSVLASSFGYNAADATAAFQAAINSSNDTIIIDLQADDWNVGPNAFFNLENKTLIFEPGVILRAIPGAFDPIYSSLLRLVEAQNVTIIGYGAEWIMNKAEYINLNDSEYRHALTIFNCNSITVRGLTIRDSGGDGIYVGGEDGGGGQGYSSEIWIEDVRSINNYRQGMSIASVENMTVRHCLFSETKGTLPEAGIDIEPFETYQRVVNLTIENCSFLDNGWSGIAVALFDMDDTSDPVSITVRDCYFRENGRPENIYSLSEIHASADAESPVQGAVFFERCFIDGSNYAAFYSRKTADAYSIEFEDCVFRDVSRLQIEYNEPIFLEVPDYENPSNALGGYAFNDIFISYTTDFNFFRVYGWSTLQGLSDISGNFTLLEPFDNGVLYSDVPDTTDVDFTFTSFSTLPSVGLSAEAFDDLAVECDTTSAGYTLFRFSNKLDYPLGVSLGYLGVAQLGNDLHLMPGGWNIPADEPGISREFTARADAILESSESVDISVIPNSMYSVLGDATLEFQLEDCLVTSLLDAFLTKDQVVVYPNPASDKVFIPTNSNSSEGLIEIYTDQGVRVIRQNYNGSLIQVNTENLVSGLYFGRILPKGKQEMLHFKIVIGKY